MLSLPILHSCFIVSTFSTKACFPARVVYVRQGSGSGPGGAVFVPVLWVWCCCGVGKRRDGNAVYIQHSHVRNRY